ncbi:hypothetical protein KR009_003253, partial [Drosophila setifemur]
MFATPQRSSKGGPLCHSTPKSSSEGASLSSEIAAVPRLAISLFGWYCVQVLRKDCRVTRNRVLRMLRRKVRPLLLEPRYLLESGACLTFHVNSYSVASKLNTLGRLDHTILCLRVGDQMPQVRIDAKYRRRLKRVLLSRFDPRQQSLDLTQFHADEAWRHEFCALAQPNCLQAVIAIVEREMPELVCLKLDRNHLNQLWPFSNVERRLPRLQRISLEVNDLDNLTLLQVFGNLPLVELSLRRNLLPAGYEGVVLRCWPTLRMLNGV